MKKKNSKQEQKYTFKLIYLTWHDHISMDAGT